MKIQESAENYLETILLLQQRKGSVRSIDIANELEFSKPSVSVAMKKLREQGYVIMDENGLLSLTEAGKNVADGVYERHKTLKKALMLLGVDEEAAAEEACKLEHAISDASMAAIEKFITSK